MISTAVKLSNTAPGSAKTVKGNRTMKHLQLTKARYLAALIRQRDRIAAGLTFEAEDSDTLGNKYTHASWGLCTNDKEAWPDAKDHIWPDQFTNQGRVAPKYRTDTQSCPMQTKGGGPGCFYSCRIFKHGTITKDARVEASALYDGAIAKAREE